MKLLIVLCSLLWFSYQGWSHEIVGLEVLKAVSEGFPEPVLRGDIGIGKRMEYTETKVTLPLGSSRAVDPTEALKGAQAMTIIKEVLSVTPDAYTESETIGTSVKEKESLREPVASRKRWEYSLNKLLKGTSVRMTFLSAELIDAKVINGFVCIGRRLKLELYGPLERPDKAVTFKIEMEEWVSKDVPGDGTVLAISIQDELGKRERTVTRRELVRIQP